MPAITDKHIQKNFSRASENYEKFASLQKEIGLALLERIDLGRAYLRMLDVGMGTGWLTQKLKEKFPRAQIVGCDFAEGMVFSASQKSSARIIQADARALPFKTNTFDAVISNCVYQWIDNLPRAFGAVYRILNTGGIFYFNCFGRETLRELFISLEKTASIKQTPMIRELADEIKIKEDFVQTGFRKVEVYRELKELPFTGMFDVIRWLKNLGAHSSRLRGYLGKQWLMKAEGYYRENFCTASGVRATFEIIWARAHK